MSQMEHEYRLSRTEKSFENIKKKKKIGLTVKKPSFQTQRSWFHIHIMSKTH